MNGRLDRGTSELVPFLSTCCCLAILTIFYVPVRVFVLFSVCLFVSVPIILQKAPSWAPTLRAPACASPPLQVLRKNYSHEADMWSLGVILYILLSGLPPFWGDTEEQIFKMVLRGHIDFKTDPWPKISDAAKNCVKRLLEQDASKRATTAEILSHEWLVKEGAALDINLDSVVLGRMRQFAQMNKLKKMCLMVVGQHLSQDEITGMKELFKSIDEDGSGTITVSEMRKAMAQWGNKISEAELANLMAIADVDGDGLIDYNEFVAATMHMSKLEKEELLQK
eukprot:364489-Chlamydomonas_euryale.AAC.8